MAASWLMFNRASRPAEAVVTTSIIGPLGIAEIGRAGGEGVGCHRRPGRVGEIGASFDHDGHAAGPVDVKPELIGPNAETGIAGLNLRWPQRGRTIAKRRAPVCGP